MLESPYMSEAVQPPPIDAVARALSDGTRRTILHLVRDDERSVGDLASEFPHMSRPAVSQHLAVLNEAGLVTVRPEGNHRMYRTRPEGLIEMRQFLDDMWDDRLSRLKNAAERAEWPDRERKRAGLGKPPDTDKKSNGKSSS